MASSRWLDGCPCEASPRSSPCTRFPEPARRDAALPCLIVVDRRAARELKRRRERTELALASPTAQSEEHLQQDQEDAHAHEAEADRLLEEDCQIAAREQERPPEVLLDQRSEHVAEQDRGYGKVECE